MNELSRASFAGSLPARHFDYLAMRVPGAWVSFGLTLAIATAGMVAEDLGKPAGGAAYLALVGVTALLFPHFTLAANRRNGLLWLFPIWAVFSAGWSIDPGRTWHSSLILVGSLVGVCAVGSMPHRRAVMTALFVTLLGFILYSLAFGHLIAMGASDTAFSGIGSGKNQFGHTAAMEVILSCVMLAWSGGRFGRLMIAVGLLGLLAGFTALLASRATGALISTSLALSTFAAVLAYCRLATPFRVAIIVALLGVAVVYLTFGKEIEQELFTYVLQRFGKDTTLTGRTELWDIADRLIAEQPLLGRGYGAFWYYTNPDAMTVWRMMGIQPMTGFTFHNTYRDILIEDGWIGLAFVILGIVYHFIRNVLAALWSGDVLSAIGIAISVYFLIRTPVETINYGQMTLTGTVFIGLICFTMKGKPVPRRRAEAKLPRWRTGEPSVSTHDRLRLRTE